MYLQLCRNCVGITPLSLNTLKITREFFQILIQNNSYLSKKIKIKSEFQIHYNRLNDAFKTIALIRLYSHFALDIIKVEHGGSRGKQGDSSSHGNTWKKDKDQVDRRTKMHNFIGMTGSPLVTRSNVDDVLPEYDLESKLNWF